MSQLTNMLYNLGSEIADAPTRAAGRRSEVLEHQLYQDEAVRQAEDAKADRAYNQRLEEVARGDRAAELKKRAERLGMTQDALIPGTDDKRVAHDQAQPQKKPVPSLYDDAEPLGVSEPKSVQQSKRDAQAAKPKVDEFGETMAVTRPEFEDRDRASFNARKALEAMEAGDKAAFDFYSARSDQLESQFAKREKAAQQGLLDTFLLRLRPTAPEGSPEYLEQAAVRRGMFMQTLEAMGPGALAGAPQQALDLLLNDNPEDDDAGFIILGSQMGLNLPEWAQKIEVDPDTGRVVYQDGLRYSVDDAGRTETQMVDDALKEKGIDVDLAKAQMTAANDREANRLRSRELDLEAAEMSRKMLQDQTVPPAYRGLTENDLSKQIVTNLETVDAAQNELADAQEAYNLTQEFMALVEAAGGADVKMLGKGFSNDIVQWWSGETTELENITNRLTPKMREAGSGEMSDKDVEMYKQSVVNINSSYEANVQMAARVEAYYLNKRDFAEAMRYAEEISPLAVRDVKAAWTAYANDFPLFYHEGDERLRERPGASLGSAAITGAELNRPDFIEDYLPSYLAAQKKRANERMIAQLESEEN